MKKIEIEKPNIDFTKKIVSYSQYSTYSKCPRRWELQYVLKEKQKDPSIHLAFGNALHVTLQTYITTMFEESVKKAECINLQDLFMAEFEKSLTVESLKVEGKWDWTSQDELEEVYSDTSKILEYFRKKRTAYITTKKHSLVGVEVPFYFQVLDDIPVYFLGYLDLVLLDERDSSIVILDIKGTVKGWNKWKKADKTTANQVVLYKKFWIEKMNWDPKLVTGEYLIFKRKLIEESLYPQKRIQSFQPTQGKVTLNQLSADFEQFVRSNFNSKGEYLTHKRKANGSQSNCRFCEFKDRLDLCSLQDRL